jgi:FkbM family methyltransferase
MMNFSSISKGSILGRSLRLPLKALPDKMPMVVLQGPIRGQRWLAGASVHGCWLGSYEQDKVRLFVQLTSPNDVVYDLGANAGYYTLVAARLIGPSGRVIAFEPVPRNLWYLRRHLKLNHVSNATLVPAAASATTGMAWFNPEGDSSMGHLSTEGTLQVPTVAIDELVGRANIEAPNVMKIDVEGAESELLRGAQRTLEQHRPVILLATHGDNVARACIALLKDLGYDIQSIQDRPIDASDEFVARPTVSA